MEISPGDLIEIFRLGYQHWAVYVGGEYIVHLVNLDLSGFSSIFSSSSSSSSQMKKGKGKVKRQRLEDVVGSDRWQVNNNLDKRCSPRPAKEIVKEALSLVGEDMVFRLADFNCEHFATKLRYGVSIFRQVLKCILLAGARCLR